MCKTCDLSPTRRLSGTCMPYCVLQGSCQLMMWENLALNDGTACLRSIGAGLTERGVCESGKCYVAAPAGCGDGVVDQGEECDDSSGCCTDR